MEILLAVWADDVSSTEYSFVKFCVGVEPGRAVGFACAQTLYVVGLDESRHGNFNRLQYKN